MKNEEENNLDDDSSSIKSEEHKEITSEKIPNKANLEEIKIIENREDTSPSFSYDDDGQKMREFELKNLGKYKFNDNNIINFYYIIKKKK